MLAACSESSATSSLSSSSWSGAPTVRFEANVPIELAEGERVQIAGNFNGWNPLAEGYALSEINEFGFAIDVAFELADVGTILEYKYVLILADQVDNPWANVEGSATGGEIGNRTHTLQEGYNTVMDTIANFKNNIDQNSVTRGTLQKVVLTMTQYEDERQRTIRIWLPDGYDQEDTTKRYPVLYMHDGQNLFDAFTSFAGEWRIDEAIGAMMDDDYEGAIVVGIDNSSDRLNELSPSWPRTTSGSTYINNPSGEKYAAFIVETVKNYVDSNFNTNPAPATTGIGGSSMGGVMSFFMAIEHADVFGFGVIFSSAMWLYQASTITDFVASRDFATATNLPRLYIYAGGLESSITPYVASMRDALLAEGYPSANIETHVDPNKNHNEAAWAQYFPIAYRWLVGFGQ